MAAATDQMEQDFETDESRQERLRDRLSSIVGRLEREADDRVGKRSEIERRWLEDLRQFHGVYEDKISTQLESAKKSTLFINETRPKTNACEARLSDMLFPTDDKNWGIQPTPVPELTVEAEQTAMRAAQAKQQAAQNPAQAALQQQAEQAENDSRLIQSRLDEAKKRARAMEEEIDDHLRGCHYAIQAREVIRDGCRLGTGVMKGPVVGGRTRRSWSKQTDPETGAEVYALEEVSLKRPVFWRVDPWSFFPDMDACSADDCESVFERHLMKPKQLRKLSRQPGFDKEAIRRLLRDKPRSSMPTYLADLRSITGSNIDITTERYCVWEYHGPLTAEDMRDLAAILGQTQMLEDVGLADDDIDPLQEINAVIWFCQSEILKFGIHSLDSGDPIYSVFNLEKDEASLFGFGIPYLMRDGQKAIASGWRAMMDNGGLASGPQVVVNDEIVEPVDGHWRLEPRKLWRRKTGAHPQEKAFEVHNIDMHQAELANIIELAKQFIDDETSVSTIAQGEQGTHTTQTAHGMSILMNSVNVVFRRIVKNWDDDMTTPNIRRIYDWLMQFSDKDYIKGDFDVDARGTSVLLVREMQSANLMAFLNSYSGHPILGRFLKKDGLPALRRLVQTLMIPANDVIKSNEEIAEDEARAAEQPPPPNPEMEKIAAQMNLEKMRGETALQVEGMRRETALLELAGKMNLKLDELRALLADKREEREHKERIFAAEAAIEQRRDARQPEAQKGSGGYFS